MRTYTLIAAGIGTLLLGLAAGAPAQAKLATNVPQRHLPARPARQRRRPRRAGAG
jgi:hypothetical protein